MQKELNFTYNELTSGYANDFINWIFDKEQKDV